MMYPFDKMTDRRHTNSYKWEVGENKLPMWVADMDFETAPEIIEAIQTKVSKGILGYTMIPEAWGTSIQSWWKQRHHLDIDPSWLIFATGVVPILSTAVRQFTNVGDNVLIQTPVYNIFFNSILNNGRNVLENKLNYDGLAYSIDFDDLELKLSDPKTSLMILCNPHNPIGKIWDKDTLEKIGSLCLKHHVLVLSDEIHGDITEPNLNYVPFHWVSEACAQNSITCSAPTKTFNLAGIHSAYALVINPNLRKRLNRALNTDEVAEPNAIAMEATITAYTQGEAWLNELNQVIQDHRLTVKEYLENHCPQVKLLESHATYLLWIDCQTLIEDASLLVKFLNEKVDLVVSSGSSYGETGKSFIRLNIACPKDRLMDGLRRLEKGINLFKLEKALK